MGWGGVGADFSVGWGCGCACTGVYARSAAVRAVQDGPIDVCLIDCSSLTVSFTVLLPAFNTFALGVRAASHPNEPCGKERTRPL